MYKRQLQKFVVEKGLDVGFDFDGDADRCLCVDEKGNVITGDHILYIYCLLYTSVGVPGRRVSERFTNEELENHINILQEKSKW